MTANFSNHWEQLSKFIEEMAKIKSSKKKENTNE